jgi:ABC-type transporter Mla subunit MlaD
VLKPIFERMRAQGSDFLDKNAALADEVRRTFADLDRIDSELKKASKAISSASGFLAKYRDRLHSLCESAAAPKIAPSRQLNDSPLAQAGD